MEQENQGQDQATDQGGTGRQDQERQAGVDRQQGQQNRQQGGEDMTGEAGERDEGATGGQGNQPGADQDA
jgi:hypothetical protein